MFKKLIFIVIIHNIDSERNFVANINFLFFHYRIRIFKLNFVSSTTFIILLDGDWSCNPLPPNKSLADFFFSSVRCKSVGNRKTLHICNGFMFRWMVKCIACVKLCLATVDLAGDPPRYAYVGNFCNIYVVWWSRGIRLTGARWNQIVIHRIARPDICKVHMP